MLRKITSVICIIIGLVVIILGISFNANLKTHGTDGATVQYSAKNYDLEYASFGGDFYTYIYKGSDTIVDVLDEINKSMETVVNGENAMINTTKANIKATDALAETVEKVGKTVIIAIGLLTLAFGVNSLGKAFTKPIPAAPVALAAEDTDVPAAKPEEPSEPQEE